MRAEVSPRGMPHSWMPKALIFLGLALAAAVVYGIALTGAKNALNSELTSVRSQLTATQNELGSTKQTLASTQTELGATKQTLASTQTELGATKQTLTTTQIDLGITKQTLASTQAELGATKQTLASTQTELGATKQTLTSTQTLLVSTNQTLVSTQAELGTTKQTLASTQVLLASTNQTLIAVRQTLAATNQSLTQYIAAYENYKTAYDDVRQRLIIAQDTLAGLGIRLSTTSAYNAGNLEGVVLNDNAAAMNPTFSQLISFLSQDRTEFNPYILDVYDCSQFARDIHNNAEAAGIRSAYVTLSFPNETYGHALNAFLTTDYGLVYVDTTESPDKIARVKTGKEYRAVEKFRVSGANVRNDAWWDTLQAYYYLPASTGGHMVTGSIAIFW